jgi:glycosyltransferase involved in cell wall biosynthesis
VRTEIVREGETGYLVPPRDPDAFADRVLRLLRDPGLRRRFGASAKEVIRRDFALPAVADEYAAVYAEVMAGGS